MEVWLFGVEDFGGFFGDLAEFVPLHALVIFPGCQEDEEKAESYGEEECAEAEDEDGGDDGVFADAEELKHAEGGAFEAAEAAGEEEEKSADDGGHAEDEGELEDGDVGGADAVEDEFHGDAFEKPGDGTEEGGEEEVFHGEERIGGVVNMAEVFEAGAEALVAHSGMEKGINPSFLAGEPDAGDHADDTGEEKEIDEILC